jgi:DNA primase
MLLEGSANRVEYQLNAIRSKYDLRQDDQKIAYVHEAAELISTLDSSVKREVYGGRVAESAGISMDAMKLEINKAFKRRMARQRKQQEKIDLAPVKALQPKDRSIRYDNMRSARAEESIIAQILREPALLEQTGKLKQSDFSVELLGRVYSQLRSRYENGLEVSLGVLADLTPQEMSHVTMISQKQQGPVNENALRDCVDTVMAERQSANISTDDDLLALRNKLKESKGTKI